MAAGWLYYHKYPPKRKCPKCGKRSYCKRIGSASNGEDFWRLFCKCSGVFGLVGTHIPKGLGL
jgi:hypothetical protein